MGIGRVLGVIVLAGVAVPFAVVAGAPGTAPRWFAVEIGGAPASIWLLDAAMLVVVLVSAFYRGGLRSDSDAPRPPDETP